MSEEEKLKCSGSSSSKEQLTTTTTSLDPSNSNDEKKRSSSSSTTSGIMADAEVDWNMEESESTPPLAAKTEEKVRGIAFKVGCKSRCV